MARMGRRALQNGVAGMGIPALQQGPAGKGLPALQHEEDECRGAMI